MPNGLYKTTPARQGSPPSRRGKFAPADPLGAMRRFAVCRTCSGRVAGLSYVAANTKRRRPATGTCRDRPLYCKATPRAIRDRL